MATTPRPFLSDAGALRVRDAAVADLPTLARFGAALARMHRAFDARRFGYPEEPLEEALAAFFAARLREPDAALLLAETADGDAVGYAYAQLEPASLLELCPASGWVHDLFVTETARGRGAGAALLDAAIVRLRAAGAGLVMLAVAPANVQAHALFASRGFACTMWEMTQREK
jgi:GNAT superfamily N-acetyltransferase